MQIHEFAVAVAEASVDATLPNRMTGIIRIGHGKAFQDAELSRNGDDRGRYADCPKSQTAAFAGSNGALWRYAGGQRRALAFHCKEMVKSPSYLARGEAGLSHQVHSARRRLSFARGQVARLQEGIIGAMTRLEIAPCPFLKQLKLSNL